MPNKLIIVGGGQAAAQAIHVLVQKGYTGTITLVGDESDPPYQRPPLSKKYLAGELDRSRLYFRPRTFYAQHDVALELGIRATGLDAQAKRLTPGSVADIHDAENRFPMGNNTAGEAGCAGIFCGQLC